MSSSSARSAGLSAHPWQLLFKGSTRFWKLPQADRGALSGPLGEEFDSPLNCVKTTGIRLLPD